MRGQLNTRRETFLLTLATLGIAGLCQDSAARSGGDRMRRRLVLPVRDYVVDVAWSGDGSRLAAASNYGGDLTVWDAAGHIISKFRVPVLGVTEDAVAFAGDGRLLITPPTYSSPEDTAVTIWDADTGSHVRDVPGAAPGKGRPFNAAWRFASSLDGRYLAVAPPRGNALVLYDLRAWRRLVTVPPMYRDAVGAIQFSYDGRLLGVGTIKGQVIVLVAEDGSRVASFPAFAGSSPRRGVEALSFSPDGRWLAVGGAPGIASGYVADTVRIFDVHSGALVTSCQDDNARIWKLAWVAGGRIAFTNGQFLQIWNPNAPAAPGPRFRVDSMSLAATADGRRLAVGNGSTVDVYSFDEMRKGESGI